MMMKIYTYIYIYIYIYVYIDDNAVARNVPVVSVAVDQTTILCIGDTSYLVTSQHASYCFLKLFRMG